MTSVAQTTTSQAKHREPLIRTSQFASLEGLDEVFALLLIVKKWKAIGFISARPSWALACAEIGCKLARG